MERKYFIYRYRCSPLRVDLLTPTWDLTGRFHAANNISQIPLPYPNPDIPPLVSTLRPRLLLPGNVHPNVPADGPSNSHPPHHCRAPHPSSSSYPPTRSCSHPPHLSNTHSCSHPTHWSITHPSSSSYSQMRSCSHHTRLSTTNHLRRPPFVVDLHSDVLVQSPSEFEQHPPIVFELLPLRRARAATLRT